jgi:hypothetical protein
MKGFFLQLVPKDVLDAFRLLDEYQKETYTPILFDGSRNNHRPAWRAEFWMDIPEDDEFFAGQLVALANVPDILRLNYRMDESHPAYSSLVEWGRWYTRARLEAQRAREYIEYCIKECNTAGQIARVLPDAVAYLPEGEVKKSLVNAERRSRLPVTFKRNTAKYEHAIGQLALGSLCPKARDGFGVFSSVKCTLTYKRPASGE